jgi:hypothetical protein
MTDLEGHSAPDAYGEVVHLCPPGDEGWTPCCDRTPFELPKSDRMTLDPTLVTCSGARASGPEA